MNFNMAHRCRHCGERFADHGGDNNPYRAHACPAGAVFPKYPHSVANRGDEKRASELFDRRLAKFWTARKTAFAPS